MIEYQFQEKIIKAQKTLRLAADISKTYYGKPITITYSGGKDSDVVLHIALKTLKPEEMRVITSITTVDAPQTNKHIKETFEMLKQKGVQTEKKIPMYKREGEELPRPINMWDLIVEKQMPPTRFMRYCCKVFKEQSTHGSVAVLGVRKAESIKRRGRDSFGLNGVALKHTPFWSLDHAEEVFRESLEEAHKRGVDVKEPDPLDCVMIENAKKNNELVCNPIYDWETREVWEYINGEKIKTNELYFQPYNFERVGCIGCPLGGRNSIVKEFSLFPHYKELYIKAFDRMLQKRREKGKDDTKGEGIHKWYTGEDVFFWWTNEGAYNVKGQITLDEWMEGAKDAGRND